MDSASSSTGSAMTSDLRAARRSLKHAAISTGGAVQGSGGGNGARIDIGSSKKE